MKRGDSSVYQSLSPDESTAFGVGFASQLRSGDILLLDGALGAGKTLFTAAICTALGIPREAVASPTYTILRQYFYGDLTVNHWDFYRISSLDELEASDFFELTADRKSITIIEWASLFPEAWNEIVPRCEIVITGGDDNERRSFKAKWHTN